MIGAERRVLIAPDKFKGSLSAAEVAAALGSGLAEHQGVTWRALPLADGGDGSVQAAVDAGIEPHRVRGSTASSSSRRAMSRTHSSAHPARRRCTAPRKGRRRETSPRSTAA